MSEMTLPMMIVRRMQPDDWDEVAALIYKGTNHWYQTHGMKSVFAGQPETTRLFCEVYEALDPGCCVLAINPESNQITGSCFYHPRETHVSLGIMNVHPDHFGKKIARRLLQFVIDFAEEQQKPVRLVSSALNLDSFSLYTKAGFVPRQAFQDLFLEIPVEGSDFGLNKTTREATVNDIPAMVALEMEISGISRAKDYHFFIENKANHWHVSVCENEDGSIAGFLASIQHAASNMLGPGVSRDDDTAAALIAAELNYNRGRTPVFLVPVNRHKLIAQLYQWGARNSEIHFAQVLGEYKEAEGVVMPTFMPETG